MCPARVPRADELPLRAVLPGPDFAPDRTELYDDLLAEEAGYEIVADFGPENPNLEKDAAGGIEKAMRLEPPSRNTNNPRIVVLERATDPQDPCPGLEG